MWIKRTLYGVVALFLLALVTSIIWTQVAPQQVVNILAKAERRAAQLEPVDVEIPGFRVATLQGGDGPPLVLIHGFGGDKDHFTRVAKYLTPHYRVIAIDLPGFGESDKPDEAAYGIRAQTERLAAVLDVLSLPSTHLGGSSMGGWIVAAFAVLYPERVDSLWLLAPGGLITANESDVRRIYRETGRNVLTAETPESFRRVMDVVFAEPPFIPGPIKRHLAERAAQHHSLHTRIFEELLQEAFWMEPQLRGNPTPALIVWGNRDRVLDASGGAIYAELLPNGTLEVMPKIGHLPMIENPKASAERYFAFRDGLAQPEPSPEPEAAP